MRRQIKNTKTIEEKKKNYGQKDKTLLLNLVGTNSSNNYFSERLLKEENIKQKKLYYADCLRGKTGKKAKTYCGRRNRHANTHTQTRDVTTFISFVLSDCIFMMKMQRLYNLLIK